MHQLNQTKVGNLVPYLIYRMCH